MKKKRNETEREKCETETDKFGFRSMILISTPLILRPDSVHSDLGAI